MKGRSREEERKTTCCQQLTINQIQPKYQTATNIEIIPKSQLRNPIESILIVHPRQQSNHNTYTKEKWLIRDILCHRIKLHIQKSRNDRKIQH